MAKFFPSTRGNVPYCPFLMPKLTFNARGCSLCLNQIQHHQKSSQAVGNWWRPDQCNNQDRQPLLLIHTDPISTAIIPALCHPHTTPVEKLIASFLECHLRCKMTKGRSIWWIHFSVWFWSRSGNIGLGIALKVIGTGIKFRFQSWKSQNPGLFLWPLFPARASPWLQSHLKGSIKYTYSQFTQKRFLIFSTVFVGSLDKSPCS